MGIWQTKHNVSALVAHGCVKSRHIMGRRVDGEDVVTGACEFKTKKHILALNEAKKMQNARRNNSRGVAFAILFRKTT